MVRLIDHTCDVFDAADHKVIHVVGVAQAYQPENPRAVISDVIFRAFVLALVGDTRMAT